MGFGVVGRADRARGTGMADAVLASGRAGGAFRSGIWRVPSMPADRIPTLPRQAEGEVAALAVAYAGYAGAAHRPRACGDFATRIDFAAPAAITVKAQKPYLVVDRRRTHPKGDSIAANSG